MWRGFVTSVVAAVSLQYIDPFGTAKLVLFQVYDHKNMSFIANEANGTGQ